MLERRQRRARRKHPAAEQPLFRFARAALVDFDKRGVLGPLLGRAAPAIAHDDRQFPEIHRLADRRVELRNARGDFVEPLHLRQGLRDHLGGLGARNRGKCTEQNSDKPSASMRWAQSETMP